MEELDTGRKDVLRLILRRVQLAGAPTRGASHAGAIHALRVASSPYGGDTSGVGDVVSMKLERLSLPEMGNRGVLVEEVLSGEAGKMLRDPETMMAVAV